MTRFRPETISALTEPRPEETNTQTGKSGHPDRKPFPTKSSIRLLEVVGATPPHTKGVAVRYPPRSEPCVS